APRALPSGDDGRAAPACSTHKTECRDRGRGSKAGRGRGKKDSAAAGSRPSRLTWRHPTERRGATREGTEADRRAGGSRTARARRARPAAAGGLRAADTDPDLLAEAGIDLSVGAEPRHPEGTR